METCATIVTLVIVIKHAEKYVSPCLGRHPPTKLHSVKTH